MRRSIVSTDKKNIVNVSKPCCLSHQNQLFCWNNCDPEEFHMQNATHNNKTSGYFLPALQCFILDKDHFVVICKRESLKSSKNNLIDFWLAAVKYQTPNDWQTLSTHLTAKIWWHITNIDNNRTFCNNGAQLKLSHQGIKINF